MSFLSNKRAEAHIDIGVKIIIGVVIGALILSGLYLLFAGNNGVMNKLDTKVIEMMNHSKEPMYREFYNEEEDKTTLQYSYDGKEWYNSSVPIISETATVYGVMSNNAETDSIEVALMKDGTKYYVITSTDGGVSWNQAYSFTAKSITHFYYGTAEALPSSAGTFSGEKFVIIYW